MFSHGKQFIISGGSFVVEQHAQRSDLDRLWDQVVPNALYNSKVRFDPPRCHPNTRRAVLDRLHRWTQGGNEPEEVDETRVKGEPDPPVTWIYGPAGAGKSAILQTMAEECDEIGILLASFFFSKSDPTRNHPHGVVPTIAYQMATKLPALRPVLHSAIGRDPFLFNKSMEVQMQQLIVEPLKDLIAAGIFDDRTTSPRLIIIDGVDECNDHALRAALLRAIASILINYHVPVIFLISSRPEQDITHTFNCSTLTGIWVSVVLDNKYGPDEDIRRFLQDSFADIKSTHPRRHAIPSDWPGESVIRHLVGKSSGQFLYSAVVIKYITTLSDLPHRRLDVVMGLRPVVHDLPFAEIDTLYTHLLSSLPNHGSETVLDILFLVVNEDSGFFFGVADLTRLFDLDDGDVELLLAPLTSIIQVSSLGSGHVNNFVIFFAHASLSDFLRDRSRSGSFYMNITDDRYIKLAGQAVKYLSSNAWETATSEAMKESSAHASECCLNFITSIIKNVDLNDELYEVLHVLRLENTWPQHKSIRCWEIPLLLGVLKDTIHQQDSPWLQNYTQLYDIYIGILAPVLRRSMTAYLSDTTLKTFMIICLTRYQIRSRHWQIKYWENDKIRSLLHPETFSPVDEDSFAFQSLAASCSGIITDFLFDSTAPEHLSLRRRDFDDAAIKILTYLCKRWRRSSIKLSLSVKSRDLKGRSKKSRFKPHDLSSRELRTRRLQFGNQMKPPMSKRSEPCELGLRILPTILKQCGGSLPLTEFIHLHMKDMVNIKPWTELARVALLEYLSPTEGCDQSDLEAEIAYYEPTRGLRKIIHDEY